ncbi:hypothetical protein BKI52_38895 [marine bacterium AO1-C]|nr:hypothetical protein BKI52_38895 [marine bacterium AO1-C]
MIGNRFYWNTSIIKMRQVTVTFVFLVCSYYCKAQGKINSIKHYNLKQVVSYFKARIGTSPPQELINYWENTWKNRASFNIYEYGKFDVLYPDGILKLTLNAPANMAAVDIKNRLYFRKKKGKITEQVYDSLTRRTNQDPLLQSQTIHRHYLSQEGRHIKIDYAIAFAKGRYKSGTLFYGFDASHKMRGIYYYQNEQMAWPVYLAKNINELINQCQGKLSDARKYIEANASYYVRLDAGSEAIKKFYKDSYKKVFGGTLNISSIENGWKLRLTKYKTFHIDINIGKGLGSYQTIRLVHGILNLQANNYQMVKYFGYYRLTHGYVCVLGTSQAIDFAKKGLLYLEYYNQPNDIFIPRKR